ncbi:hypothetical protein F4780DRAFT_437638 [Xylariomycetidae sp. FL0641]|nr:hypothetical protein F4780DRAFT_437638 [Xylariomycetidae sp. FL0641]
MADRAAAPPPPHIMRPSSRTARAPAAATATSGVRRNLFQSQLTRRPTGPNPHPHPHSSTTASTSSTEQPPPPPPITVHHGGLRGALGGDLLTLSMMETAAAAGGGGGGGGQPPPQQQQFGYYGPYHGGGGGGAPGIPGVSSSSSSSDILVRGPDGEPAVGDPPTPALENDPDDVPPGGALDDVQENERERRKLAEAVRQHHQIMPAQSEEVLETLRASMRAQVAALSEDNWMYEPEEPVRG